MQVAVAALFAGRPRASSLAHPTASAIGRPTPAIVRPSQDGLAIRGALPSCGLQRAGIDLPLRLVLQQRAGRWTRPPRMRVLATLDRHVAAWEPSMLRTARPSCSASPPRDASGVASHVAVAMHGSSSTTRRCLRGTPTGPSSQPPWPRCGWRQRACLAHEWGGCGCRRIPRQAQFGAPQRGSPDHAALPCGEPEQQGLNKCHIENGRGLRGALSHP